LRALENGVRVHVLVTKHGSPGVDTPADAEAVAASLCEGTTSPAGLRLQKSRAGR
jgi:CMP-2-keto-3-deoxyoctulosonic acid synthetase